MIVTSSLQWELVSFAGSGLITRGLYWRFTAIVSHFPRLIVSATPLFSLLATKKFNNDFKKEGVGDCRNSFYAFVSDRSRSGFAENRIQIRVS